MKRKSLVLTWSVGCMVITGIMILGTSRLFSHEVGSFIEGKEPLHVSLVELLANTKQFDGAAIQTIGFLSIEFEGDAIYLHREDYRYGLEKNSFRLRLSDSQRKQFEHLNLRYVLIEGTVYATGPESKDRWSGAVGQITRLEVWPIDRDYNRPK